MKAWKRIEPTVVSKIGYRTIVTKTFEMPDGQIKHFQTIDAEETNYAGVIALTPDNQVIVARQYRPGPEKIMDEIPGGRVDPEDKGDFEAAAKREFEEETGYRVGSIEPLGEVRKTAYVNSTWHYYFATDCTPLETGQKLDDTEHIEVHLIRVDQLVDNAKNARMTDAEAVFLALHKLTNEEKEPS